MTRQRISFSNVFGFIVLALIAAPATAAPLLTGAAVSFAGDFGGGPASVQATDVVVVGPGSELAFGDGSNIGSSVLLDFEAIDFDGLSLTYTIQGGANVDLVQAGYSDNGMLAGAFTFSGLALDLPGYVLSGFTTSLTDVIDSFGVLTGFSLVGSTFTMPGLERLLIANGTPGVGRVTVTFTARDTGAGTTTTTSTPTTTSSSGGGSVPEPSVLALTLLAMAVVAKRMRATTRPHHHTERTRA